MESSQKFLNDRPLTRMEKYSVIKVSGRKLSTRGQCDAAAVPLFFAEHALHQDTWSVSGAWSASARDQCGTGGFEAFLQASSFWWPTARTVGPCPLPQVPGHPTPVHTETQAK